MNLRLGELKRIYGANVDDTTTPKKYTGHQTAFNNGHTPTLSEKLFMAPKNWKHV
jgi:hypothetical protein